MNITKASSMAIDTWLHNIPADVICKDCEWQERCPVNGEWSDKGCLRHDEFNNLVGDLEEMWEEMEMIWLVSQ